MILIKILQVLCYKVFLCYSVFIYFLMLLLCYSSVCVEMIFFCVIILKFCVINYHPKYFKCKIIDKKTNLKKRKKLDLGRRITINPRSFMMMKKLIRKMKWSMKTATSRFKNQKCLPSAIWLFF